MFLSARTFEEIESLVNNAFNENTFRKAIQQERNLYTQSKDKTHLYQAVYLEAFLQSNLGNGNGRITKLLWVIENCPETEYKLYVSANYHLSSYLTFLNSPKTAEEFTNLAIKVAKKNSYKEYYANLYSSKAAIEYHLGNYYQAIPNYKLALKNGSHNDFVFRASMNNNVSLCYTKLKQYHVANGFIRRAIIEMDRIKNKNESQIFFLNLIKGNLGSNYFRMGRLGEAQKLLENEVNYYFLHVENSQDALHSVQDLIAIYTRTNNNQALTAINAKITFFEKHSKSLQVKNEYIKLLYDSYLKRNDAEGIKKYSQKLIQNNQILTDSIVKNSESLNNAIFSQKIKHLKNQFKSKDKLLETTIRAKRTSTIFLILIFSSISLIIFILYSVKVRNARKNELIYAQEQELENNKRIILENELKLKQEKITNFAINLNIKKETENAFLQKLKDIRRKKNVDPETIIKELQFSVSNLINIDQKNIASQNEIEHESTKFISSLKTKHPELNKQEVGLCSYFRMNLNSKEIASLTGMTSGTIRVYKNKIKVKIGLQHEESLNEYLQNL